MSQDDIHVLVQMLPVIIAIFGAILAGIRAVAIYYIDKRVHDAQLRKVLEDSVNNGLGSIQQAASGAITQMTPSVPMSQLANIPATLRPGVQYVLTHAAASVKRFCISPEAIAEKLVSRAGLKEIDTNMAITASPSPVTVAPLAPSEPVTEGAPPDRGK